MLDLIAGHGVDLVINIPKNHTKRELTNGYRIRRWAIDHNIPLLTNARLAGAYVKAFLNKARPGAQARTTSGVWITLYPS